MAYKVKTSGSGYVMRTYACTSGGTVEEHTFEVRIRADEHPKFCLECGFPVSATRRPRPAKVSIGGAAIVKTTDRMYRSLEDTSAARAEALNNPALKVTNMRDSLREGDVAAPPPNVSANMAMYMQEADRAGIRYGWGGGTMGAPAFHSATPTPVPQNAITGAGHSALWTIQGEGGRTHQQALAGARVAGEIKGGK